MPTSVAQIAARRPYRIVRPARARSMLACAGTACIISACASSGATPRELPAATTPRIAVPVAAQPDALALPPLAVDQLSEGGASAQRIRHFDAVNQDVRLVVRALAENFGFGHQIDPDVRGSINLRLENATLEQALGSALGPLGFAFQIEGQLIRVTGTRMQTRMFSLDYVSLSRIGTTTTVSTRRLGGGGQFGGVGQTAFGGVGQAGIGGQFGAGFGGAGGSETIQSVTAADLWAGIRVALEAIVFDTPAAAAPADTAVAATPAEAVPAATAPVTPVAPTAPGRAGVAYTPAMARSTGDGRQLVIDPFAGTIMVTAPAATLALVDSYINTIQSAVQRQVLIEAKIVEVELRREFRFGIDWRRLAETARLGVEFLGGATEATNTITIRLGGGSSQVQVALRALETQGDVSVLASPMISAMHNQPAQFDATDDEVFFRIVRQPILGPQGQIVSFNTEAIPQQISVGIILNVLAQIGADNTIMMLVRPGLSEVLDTRVQQLPEGGSVSAPVVRRRDTDTMARVRSGETIIIGGLNRTRRQRVRSGVPGLQDVPLIGGAFSSRDDVDVKNEIVIFLTPTIITGSALSAAQ